MKYINN